MNPRTSLPSAGLRVSYQLEIFLVVFYVLHQYFCSVSFYSPSALYSKPSKATPSSGVTSIPLSEDEELGRKARWELMKKELDLASSNAASMLQRSRSKSLSAAERRDRRQISVKEMDTASDSKSQEQSKRPK